MEDMYDVWTATPFHRKRMKLCFVGVVLQLTFPLQVVYHTTVQKVMFIFFHITLNHLYGEDTPGELVLLS